MIRPVGFVDTAFFTAALIGKYRDKLAGGLLPLRARDGEGEAADLPILKDWKSGKALLTRLRSQLAMFNQGKPVRLGEAALEQLDTGASTEWCEDEDEYSLAVFRLRISLVPSAGDWLYCNGAQISPAVGHIINYDHTKLHSAVNFGPCRRIHLIVDVMRPEPPDETEALAIAALKELETA